MLLRSSISGSLFHRCLQAYCCFTMQPPIKDIHEEPIPDEVINMIKNSSTSVQWIFRLHPNHRDAVRYSKLRLPPELN